MKIYLIGTSDLIYSCAKRIRKNNQNHEITILDTDFSLWNKRYEKEFNIFTGTKQELMNILINIKTPTLVLSVNNRYLLPKEVVKKLNLTILNLHHALLPNHPGRNAEAWAVFEGDEFGGVTWHYVDTGVDTGKILWQGKVKITEHMRSIDLLKECNALAVEAIDYLMPFEKLGDLKVIVQQNNQENRKVHLSTETPNNGFLDLDWPISKISCFLRALDYGIKYPLGIPKIKINDKEYEIAKYSIETNHSNQEKKILIFNDHSKIEIIEEKLKITLQLK